MKLLKYGFLTSVAAISSSTTQGQQRSSHVALTAQELHNVFGFVSIQEAEIFIARGFDHQHLVELREQENSNRFFDQPHLFEEARTKKAARDWFFGNITGLDLPGCFSSRLNAF